MRSFLRVLALIAAAMLFLVDRVSAQGCDEGIINYTVSCDTADKGIVNASRCWSFGGSPCEYCSQGSGDCIDSKKVDHPYYLANVSYDETCPDCGPPCPPPPPYCGGGESPVCNSGTWSCQQNNSPIIIDTTGKGFQLTSAEAGVAFDIRGDDHPIRLAWTAGGSGIAFLALDRNHNGKIDNGKELFGNFTEQPKSEHPNGFLALAEFDKRENGGNGDGVIDNRDMVFSQLLLWIDENHNGISEKNELHTLTELGVYSISLHYRDDRSLFDQYGNWFHYQAALNPDPHDGESRDGRVTYDVFFVAVLPTRVRQSVIAIPQGNLLELSLDHDFAWTRRSRCHSGLQTKGWGGAK